MMDPNAETPPHPDNYESLMIEIARNGGITVTGITKDRRRERNALAAFGTPESAGEWLRQFMCGELVK